MGHALMENRHRLLVDFALTQARETAERDMAPHLIDQARQRGFHPRNLGADKGYDTVECVAALRQRGVTPHVAQNTSGRRSAIDERTTRRLGVSWIGDLQHQLLTAAAERELGSNRDPALA